MRPASSGTKQTSRTDLNPIERMSKGCSSMEKTYDGETFHDLRLSDDKLTGYQFMDCTFKNCSLERVPINGCEFINCTFSDCSVVESPLSHCEIRRARFQSCSLIGINWDPTSASSAFGSPLETVTDCILRYNNFVELTLSATDFRGSVLPGSTFSDCTLFRSTFYNCDLTDTEFLRCDLRSADFRNASGYHIDTPTCNIRNAKFSFPEVVNLLVPLGVIID